MRARRPAAAGEPAQEFFGQQWKRRAVWFNEAHRRRLGPSDLIGRAKKPNSFKCVTGKPRIDFAAL
jgi:hypothetical protein